MILLRLNKSSILKINAICPSSLTLNKLYINKSLISFSTSKKLFGQKNHTQIQQTNRQNENINKLHTTQLKIKNKPKWANKIPDSQNQKKNHTEKSYKQVKNPIENTAENKKSSFLSNKKSNQQQTEQSNINFQQSSHNNQPSTQPKSFSQNKKPRKFQKDFTTTERQNTSYNFRSCEMILYQFKDIAKQSKNVRSLIRSFDEYSGKLKEQNVQQTDLKEKYKSIMYSAMMRTFARILRRQNNPDRRPMIEFLGPNYENVSSIPLQDLRTLEISDFVSFFFLFELVGRYKSVSQSKLRVVERYLRSLYERYKQNKGMSAKQNQKELVDEQKMQKRYLSEIILGARCAQLFDSQTYELYLDLILQHITTKQLVPYKMVSIVKFIMRGQNTLYRSKQLILLQKIVDCIQLSDVLSEMDESSLREFYGNMVAIVGNNQRVVELQRVKHSIIKIEQHLIQRINKFEAQQIYIISCHALKSHYNNYKLAKYIYANLFNNINQHGETSINPLFVVMLMSNINQNCIEQIKLYEIDSLWQIKKVLMLVKKYLIGQKPLDNLLYYSQYLSRLVQDLPQTSPLYRLLIDSLINNKLIIPYDHQALLIENHYLNQNKDHSLIYATLYRLKNGRSHIDKKNKLYDSIFDTLLSNITQEQMNNIYETYKQYIQSIGEIKRNRQGYVYTIAKLCCVLKKQQQISELFNESLIQILKFDSQSSQISKSYNKFIKTQQISFTQIMDYKCRQKIYALMSNYVAVLFELKPFIRQKQFEQQKFIYQKIRTDKFIQLISKNQQIQKIFLQVLSSKDTGQIMTQNFDKLLVKYLMGVTDYLIRNQKASQKNIDQTNNKIEQKTNIRMKQFFNALKKNYPISTLESIDSIPQIKKLIKKIE